MDKSIVLASGSPRRLQLVRLLGVTCRTEVSPVDESLDAHHDAVARAKELALAKARAVAVHSGQAVILAADTLIAFRGRLLGKPRDHEEAGAILRALRGTWHRVLTGVAVIDGETGKEFVAVEETRVLMRRYSDAEIAAYVASGDPMDKAAAYAIQNRAFHPVERLEVCYCNVMGLPLCATRDLLRQAGLVTPVDGERLRSRECSYCQQAASLSR
jgi:MAF protein